MNVILQRNLDGVWASGNGGRGFVQRGGEQYRLCKGLTRLLRRSYRAGAGQRIPGAVASGSGWRTESSSRVQGAHVHRVLMHEIMCRARGCQCARAGGVVPCATPGRFASACVRAARCFAAENNLQPLAGELVLLHPKWPLGTRLDAMYYDREGRLVLVSWKTGRGARDKREEHINRVQVACERALLQLHGVRVFRTCIVQLGVAAQRDREVAYYVCEWLDDTVCGRLYSDLERRFRRRFGEGK